MDEKRRRLLTWIINSGTFVVLAKIVYAFISGASLEKVQQPHKVLLGKSSELFATSQTLLTSVNNVPIVVFKESDNYKGLVLTCTHTACTLHYQESTGTFLCGCHGGEFYKNGTVKAPPPQRDMTKLIIRQHGDELWVVMPHT